MKHDPRAPVTKITLAILLVGSLSLLGCPTIRPLTGPAQPGNGPYPEAYREIVHAWIDTEFADLQGINSLQITPPVPGVAQPFLRATKTLGWQTIITLRGYDRIGMPTGPRRYHLLIRDGHVAQYVRQVN